MGAEHYFSSGDIMISVTEIILIIAGILAVIIGYLIPAGKESSGFDVDKANQKVNDMVTKAIKNSQPEIDSMLDESMEEAINKAERAMDRVTNEKMSAISEYSDTVMNDIHKNHDEVVFMYDMLNDKHKNLKNTVSEANRAAREVKEAEAKRQIELEEEAKLKAQLEAEAKAKAKAEAEEAARLKAEAEEAARLKAKAEEEARLKAKAEEEARRKAEASAQTKNQAESEVTFTSLTDILDKADAAAAKKTQARVIGPSQADDLLSEMQAGGYYSDEEEMELHSKYWPETNEEDFLDETADEAAGNEPKAEEKPAKVVSISEAPRKKAMEVPEQNDVISDPASRNQKILDMHKQGKSAVVIARELRLGIGEVKLVIDLAGKHKRSRSSIM